jgi:predicted  nucleic acid-binding Zn-ribbon protein
MGEKLVKEVFEALFALEDIREILRRTAPFHRFTDEEMALAKASIERAKKAIEAIEEELQP